jgi:SulP family sulfate permease
MISTQERDLVQALPISTWLPTYKRDWLRADVIAGLTIWAVVVPQAIAYAQIAGLPPQAGLFTAFAGALAYGLFGTSRQLVVSPMSGSAAVSAAIIAPIAGSNIERYAGLSALLAIEAGIIFILLGWWKAGFVSQFVAVAVQTGFLVGLGMTIIVGQTFKVLGISGKDGTFFQQLWHMLKNLDETSGWTAVVGLAGLAAMLLFKRFMPTVPAALIVVFAAILIVTLFDLNDHGVAVVGNIDREIPLPSLPSGVHFDDLIALFPGALAVAVIGYTETNTVSEQFADEHKYDINSNQELVALGAANIFSGFFKGFITGGGASQSAANDRAGAKTQISLLIMAVLIALTSALLMPIFKNLPLAILGAIVISAVMGFINVPAMQRIRHLRRDSFLAALLAMIGVLVLGVLPGLLLAIVLSVLLLLGRESRPGNSIVGNLPGTRAYVDTVRYPEALVDPQILIFRLDSPLMFINASWMRESLREHVRAADPPPRVVLVDMQFSHELDIQGLDKLTRIEDELRESGIELWLANVHYPVAEMLRRGELSAKIGEDHIYQSLDDAVEAAKSGGGTSSVSPSGVEESIFPASDQKRMDSSTGSE